MSKAECEFPISHIATITPENLFQNINCYHSRGKKQKYNLQEKNADHDINKSGPTDDTEQTHN